MCDGEHGQVPVARDRTVPAAAWALFSACAIQIAARERACAWLASLLPHWLSLIRSSGQGGACIEFQRIVVTCLLLWSLKMVGRVKMLSLLLIYQEKTPETGLLKSEQTPTNCFVQVTPTLIYQLSEALESLIFTISQKNSCWGFFNHVASVARELPWVKNVVMTKHVVWQGYLSAALPLLSFALQ